MYNVTNTNFYTCIDVVENVVDREGAVNFSRLIFPGDNIWI